MHQSSYLSSLTSLRGIAALLVLVFHSSIFILPLEGTAHTQIISKGFLWVDFFFVLSGFVITHVYGSYFKEKVNKVLFRKYMLARFARVYPLHVFTMIWSVASIMYIRSAAETIFSLFNPVFDYRAIPASLLFIQSMHLFPTPPLNTPSWSLSTEWWVYLLFPFLVNGLYRLNLKGQMMLLMAVAGLYLSLMYYIAPAFGNLHMGGGRATIDLTADFGFLRCLSGFLLGMLLYLAYQVKRGYQFLNTNGAFILSSGSVLLAMHFGANDLLIIALFVPVLLSAAYNTGRVQQVLTIRPLQRLGEWSFSIYMVHIPLIFMLWCRMLSMNTNALADFGQYGNTMLSFAPDFLPGWSMCLLWITLTVMIAALTYQYIEVPCRNYLNNHFKGKANKKQVVAA